MSHGSILLSILLSCQVSVDIRSPAAGVITKFMVAEGDTVNVGVPFAEIDTAAAGEAAAAPGEGREAEGKSHR